MAPVRSGEKKKRGRPRKSDAQPTAPQKRTSKQHKQPKVTPARSEGVRKESSRGRKRKSRVVDEPDEIAESQPAAVPKYRRLAPKAQRIPQQLIETWPEITPPLLEQIRVLLKRAKDETVLSRRDLRKREEAERVLDRIVGKLERHVARLKMPPQAKALNFDLDKLTERNEHVHREVTTARHRKQLLEEQVKMASATLEADEKLVRALKDNAHQWRRRWKSQEKKQLHPLLQSFDEDTIVDDRPEDIGLRRTAPAEATLLETPDVELAPLLEQLRRNLETMQGNHAQVEGLHEAVSDAQVALDDVLFKHASAQQYDAI